MVRLDGGTFWMGSESALSFPQDGEGPVRQITLSPFWISRYPVTVEQFAEFARVTRYKTDAERLGSSFVFRPHSSGLDHPSRGSLPWWVAQNRVDWAHPNGSDSKIYPSLDYPVVHVSWNDAIAYCRWAGVRLPTEAEWEFASRGGLDGKEFPWGDELTPNGRHMCNVWQGFFPDKDTGEDGFVGVAPVASFTRNEFGLYTTIGNVWEWCWDYFRTTLGQFEVKVNPAGPPSGAARVLKGGSFLCHESYCRRYRNAARIANTEDTSTANIGFRVARDL